MPDVLINNLLSAPAFSNDLTSFYYIPSVFPSTSMSDPFQQLVLNWERRSAPISLCCIPSSSLSTLNLSPCVLIKTLMLPPVGISLCCSYPPHPLYSPLNCYVNSQHYTGANCLHLGYICSQSRAIIDA